MHKADNLPPYCTVVKKSGSLNLLEPSGPAWPVTGQHYLLYGQFIESKCDIYYADECRTPAGCIAAEEQREYYLKHLQIKHQLLALKALFTEDQVTFL